MKTGALLSNRYELNELAGMGGMGEVYRALDRFNGQTVAIKVLTSAPTTVPDSEMTTLGGSQADTPPSFDSQRRFQREIKALSALSHPAIVKYLEQGSTKEGVPYLVMEWLEGEGLESRLSRERLSDADSVELVRRSAEGLAVAHRAGIVHRDIKPSNIWLVDKDPRDAKVIDFGLARRDTRTQAVTRTGGVLGTIGYMAPEQAMGTTELDVRADVFSLGCVLYECLCSEPAFSGQNAVAVLAKLLHSEPEPPSSVRGDLPGDLCELLQRMLSREINDRPRDAGEVAEALSSLRLSGAVRGPLTPPPRPALTGRERRVWCVLLVQSSADVAENRLAQDLVSRHGGELTSIEGGALMVTFDSITSATDQAREAAQLALALESQMEGASISLATGLGERDQTLSREPTGPVIDRAAGLLERALGIASPPGVFVDDITKGLLASSFNICEENDLSRLSLETSTHRSARSLLGRQTPFVGRNKELALLKATFEECLDEEVAQAMLVIGSAGIGKSRLRIELIESLQDSDVRIIEASAESRDAGTVLTLARRIVRRAAGIHIGDEDDQQRERLDEHLNSLGTTILERVDREFLGELLNLPIASPSPELLAARGAPHVMALRLRTAFEQWATAVCTRGPTLFVLENLHWADRVSLDYVGTLLDRIKDLPAMILGLARPEVKEALPGSWGSALAEVRLAGLTRKAARRIVDAIVAENIPDAQRDLLVQRAEGNAFFLEELIRHVVEDHADTAPETVIALVQTRLLHLEPDARRILRAASIFGLTFWENSVRALLGDSVSKNDIRHWILSLVESEVLTLGDEGRFACETEYRFRHALVRDGAYEMLTEKDRRRGHLKAAEWLESAHETDGRYLAEHFELGGAPERAAPCYLVASKDAFASYNLKECQAFAKRGIECNAEGETLGMLRHLVGVTLGWQGQMFDAVQEMEQALPLLPEDDDQWLLSASLLGAAAMITGQRERADELVEKTLSRDTVAAPTGPNGFALWQLNNVSFGTQDKTCTDQVLAVFDRSLLETDAGDPAFKGWHALSVCEAGLWRKDTPAISLAKAYEARALFERLNDLPGQQLAGSRVAISHIEAGCLQTGLEWAQRMVTACGSTEYGLNQGFAMMTLGRAQGLNGQIDIASNMLSMLLTGFEWMEVFVRGILAECFIASERLDEAKEHAEIGATKGKQWRSVGAMAMAALARVHLLNGEPDKAITMCRELDDYFIFPSTRSLLELTEAESLLALDRNDEANQVLVRAKSRIDRIVGRLPEDTLKSECLAFLPHQRVIELSNRS